MQNHEQVSADLVVYERVEATIHRHGRTILYRFFPVLFAIARSSGSSSEVRSAEARKNVLDVTSQRPP